MWRQKTDKRLVAAGLLILALIIGYNAWNDMQPKPFVSHKNTMTAYTLVTRQEDIAAVKKDETASGIFWAGDIAGDPPTITPSPVPPTGLTQQSSMPLFKMESLPPRLSPLFDAIAVAIKPWVEHTSTVNDIYIDYLSKTPDLDGLSPLTNGIRGYFEQQYWVVIGLRRTPLTYPQETITKLGNMLKSVEYFVYYLDDVTAKGETLAQTVTRIGKEGIPFMLRTATVPDYEALRKSMPDGQQSFGGFIIEAAKPETEEKAK
jgi:hypothetical protein